MDRLLGKLTYANVISTLALFLVVAGGSAFAAARAASSGPTTVKLCAAKKGGALRLPSNGSCKGSEQTLTLDARGATGAPGPVGPVGATGERGAQGERGQNGPAGLVSPDGRFSITATNAGVVLTGPKGSLTFDGEELLAAGNLKVYVPQSLTVTDGLGLDITSGVNTSFTTGANFVGTVGGAYEESVGAAYSQSVGGAYAQTLGAGYEQDIAKSAIQRIGAGYEQEVVKAATQSVGGALTQEAGGTFEAASSGTAVLNGSAVRLGGTSLTCPAAARIGSFIESFGRIEAQGSSTKVFVC